MILDAKLQLGWFNQRLYETTDLFIYKLQVQKSVSNLKYKLKTKIEIYVTTAVKFLLTQGLIKVHFKIQK